MRLSVLVLFASLPLGACAVGTDYSSIAANPTPELINESQRDIDIIRNEMVMDNIKNACSTVTSVASGFEIIPSRLSPFPITYTSGMPR